MTDHEDRIPFTELTASNLTQLYNDLDRADEAIGELNDFNVRMVRDLNARNAQLSLHLTRLQLELARINQVRGLTERWRSTPYRSGPLQELLIALGGPAPEPQGHIYLSTGCLHGDHNYCKSMTGIQGSKRGGKCKHCDAQCICTCHTEGANDTDLTEDDNGDEEPVVEPYCNGFPTGCPNPVTVPPAPPHHRGGIRCGCYDEETHIVTDNSDDPEHVDDCSGCPTEVPCAGVYQHVHTPHEWQPQPGMDIVLCPGHPRETE